MKRYREIVNPWDADELLNNLAYKIQELETDSILSNDLKQEIVVQIQDIIYTYDHEIDELEDEKKKNERQIFNLEIELDELENVYKQTYKSIQHESAIELFNEMIEKFGPLTVEQVLKEMNERLG